MNSKKKTGSYYTPLDLADFIVQHLKPSLNDTNSEFDIRKQTKNIVFL